MLFLSFLKMFVCSMSDFFFLFPYNYEFQDALIAK